MNRAMRVVNSLHRRRRSPILNCVQLFFVDFNDWNDRCLGSYFFLLNRSSLRSCRLFIWFDFAEIKLGNWDEWACRSRFHILNRNAPLSTSPLLPSTTIILWLLHWVMVVRVWVLRQCVTVTLALWIIVPWIIVFQFRHLSFKVFYRFALQSNFIIQLLSNLDLFLQLFYFLFHFS